MIGISPAIFYLAICLTVSGNTAILVAGALSIGYAVVMMLVIVGTLMNAFKVRLGFFGVFFLVSIYFTSFVEQERSLY